MRFRIGPWVYRVRVCEGSLAVDGRRVDGMAHGGEILLCGLIPGRDRLRPLLDQLRRLHELHYGALSGEGVGTFAADVMRQLRAQGDEPALMRLTSPDQLVAVDADTPSEPVGCECGRCGTRYGEHQIATGAPALDAKHARMAVSRAVYCDFCGVTMSWSEGATPAGGPNGRVMSGPAYSRG